MFEHNPSCFPLDSTAKMWDGKRVDATPNGEFYPSITTVIGNNAKKQAGLAKWCARVGKENASAISTRSASRSTAFHSLTDHYLNKCLDIDQYTHQPLPVIMFEQTHKPIDRISNIYLQ